MNNTDIQEVKKPVSKTRKVLKVILGILIWLLIFAVIRFVFIGLSNM